MPANEKLTPLENIIALSLNARLRGQSLTLARAEVESLCDVLEEFVTLKAKLSRPNNSRPRKFASDTERYAYHNAKRKKPSG